jgi:hypothetical protein
MGMSNYLPSSRISQSGVCTSTTRPASPYEGQVIYETDTDRVLVWNASAWVAPNSQTANPPGLEFIKSVNLSGTTTQVTSVFTTDYDDYLITGTNIVTSGANAIWFRYLSNTTPASGNYYYAEVGLNSGGTSENVQQANFAQGYTGVNAPAGSVSSGAHFQLMVHRPHTNNITICKNDGQALGSSVYWFRTGVVGHDVTAQYNGIEILTTTAVTFTAGTIRVYGYRN